MSHSVTQSISRLIAVTKSRHPRRGSHPRTLVVESLELRTLLSGTIYTVDSITDTGAGAGNTGDLLYCVTQANSDPNADGTEIEFEASVFNASDPQMITLSSTLVLSDKSGPEVIQGPGASIVTISGGNAVGVFQVAGSVTATLGGMTITGGAASEGAGVSNQGNLTITGSTISSNSGGLGGGISSSGMLTISASTISGNTGQTGGGIVCSGKTLIEDNTVISGNKGGNQGGRHP